jgi:hypothetical protein
MPVTSRGSMGGLLTRVLRLSAGLQTLAASSGHKTLRILRLVLHNRPQTAGCRGAKHALHGEKPSIRSRCRA